MSDQMLNINGARLWETLEASGQIGKIEKTGLRRLALTKEDKEMRDLLVSWATKEGCSAEYDEVGNLFIRKAGKNPDLPAVAMGSHLDTQFYGGRYDGILGVLAGLECIRVFNENNIVTEHPIDLIVWMNEEGGRFTPPMMGSSAFVGIYSPEELYAATDSKGISLIKELEKHGWVGSLKTGARELDSYFELHIEQGPILDAVKRNIGIITGSYKAHGMKIEVTGETAHVGPTPMEDRKNALVGAGYLISAVNDIGWKYSKEGSKSTVTHIDCHPNLFGIIPNLVNLTIDFRHPDLASSMNMLDEVMKAIEEASEKAKVKMEIKEKWLLGQLDFSEDCISLLKETAKTYDLDYIEMESQAGHDAYSIAQKIPTAMIFTPCKKGYTHNTKEEINLERTIPGVNLLVNTVLRRANRVESKTK